MGTIFTLLIIEETASRLRLTRGDGGWTGGRREKARQDGGSEAGNEGGREGGGNEAGRRKRGSAPPYLLIEEDR